MQNEELPKQLIYVADPMCSWCYGFAPVIEAIVDQFCERLPITLLMGGLRAGNTKAMTDADRQSIREHWQRVNAATGQPFDFSFFDQPAFVYDTEPSCRAVVTMRLLNPTLALPYMHRIQTAFYAENRDTTSTEILAEVAAECGVDRESFVAEMRSPEARNTTFQDFITAQKSGIRGFPTLLAGPTPDGFAIVTHGYTPIDGILESLETWLAETNTQH